jgi:hypothetical protein
MQPYGVSFTPTNQALEEQPGGQTSLSGIGAPRGQEAIRTLSLRLPRRPMFNGIAPAPLLGAPGAMGAPGPGEFSFAAQSPQPSAGPVGQAPSIGGAAAPQNPMMQAILRMAQMAPQGGAPRVTPGITPNEQGPQHNPFPNAPGGHTLPRPEDPVARSSPNPGATPLTQRQIPQEFPVPQIPFLGSGWSPYTGGGGFY